MSLAVTLANAASGLSVAQAALATTASNVSNVNTPGYTRKVVQQETRILAGQSAGARALDVTRIADQFVASQAREQAIRLGRSDMLAAIHQRIQDTIYGEPAQTGRGISSRLTDLLTSLDALAASPHQVAARSEVLGRIEATLSTLTADLAAIETIRSDVDHQIGQVIGSINTDITELAAINQQFSRGYGSADLEDRRDGVLARLAGRIDIQVGWQDDGQVDVTTRNGTVLLDGEPRQVVYEPASSTGPGSPLGRIAVYAAKDIDRATGLPVTGARSDELVSAGTRAALSQELAAAGAEPVVSNLRGGSLQGLIEARDRVLPELADQLAELAMAVRHRLNAAHNDAATSPPPATLSGTRAGLAPTAGFVGSGTATIALVDRSSGTAASAFQLDLAGFTSVDDVLAAVNTASSGAVSASLDGQGRLVLASSDPLLGIAISEGDSAIATSDSAGHGWSFGFSHYFGLNDLIVDAPGGSVGRIRPDIAANGFALATATLDAAAGPPLVASLGGKGDGTGAARLAAALREPGSVVARGGLPAYAVSVTGYAADITSLAASAAAEAQRVATGDQALATDLATRQGSLSGVNLDEEMSRLILYQQAYSVSARIISITDDLFGELLRIAG
ncbi:flagellar hook-associated protein FlgK [Geminicoccus harenae]|uniref:flagellar hook-associated protein FlgK n=2 Tax=Geminicoccus harenae TaxID=2498453 RepID=UPI001C982014|nr:flagellar basal body rod C-terminal domain-containing protein [Geminicoccus harenae]